MELPWRLFTTGVSGGSTTIFNRYTPSGWIAASTHVTNGQTFPFAYTYNVAGGLETMSYPSGRQVTNCYSAVGRVTTLGNGAVGSSSSFVSNALYAPDGQLAQMLLGNGVTETIGFNARLQPTSVVATGSAGTALSLGYGYGGSNNNGNVQSQSIVNLGASQAYSYDPLNRVATAQETGGPATGRHKGVCERRGIHHYRPLGVETPDICLRHRGPHCARGGELLAA